MTTTFLRAPFVRSLRWGVLAASLSFSLTELASAQYSWVNTANQSGNWNAPARWTGGPADTVPNAPDATATLNLPLSTAPSGVYNVQLSNTAGEQITIGGLTVNNYVGANDTANLRIGGNGNGTLTFETSSGSAFYTENAAVGEGATPGITNIFAPVTFASNTVITQNHAIDNNNGTQFSSTANSPGGVTAASGITITKEGAGNVTFEVDSPDFLGSVVVNQGAVRLTDNVFTNAGSVTVNSGGQFQIGSATVTNWILGAGSSLFLNGNGKATGVNSLGAFRQNNNAAVTSFDSPVVLQSDSNFAVQGASQLTLSQPVSGAGGLDKSNSGTLILGGTGPNTYGGVTNVLGGTLQLAKPAGVNAVPGDISVQNPVGNTQATLLLAAGEQIADTASVTLFQSTGSGFSQGTFTLNGFSETVAGLNSAAGAGIVQNGAATPSVLHLATGASPSAFGGVLQDGGSAALALEITGAQSVTLSGASTYTGGTTVNAATLIVDNLAGSATGPGDVTLSNGATLSGAGTIDGNVLLLDASFAPGSSPGTITLGNATFSSLSQLIYDLSTPGVVGSGINDLAVVLGDITLDGTLDVVPLPGFGAGVYRLFDYGGALTDHGLALVGVPQGYTGELDFSTPNQVNLSISAVPEPAAWTLAVAGLFALGPWVRGRTRRARHGS